MIPFSNFCSYSPSNDCQVNFFVLLFNSSPEILHERPLFISPFIILYFRIFDNFNFIFEINGFVFIILCKKKETEKLSLTLPYNYHQLSSLEV